MTDAQIQEFIDRWKKSGASEKANFQSFINELYDVLEVPTRSEWVLILDISKLDCDLQIFRLQLSPILPEDCVVVLPGGTLELTE